MSFQNLIRPEIREMAAYQADVVPVKVKLDANENPYHFSDALLKELFAELAAVPLNRYPDSETVELRDIIARKLQLSRDQILLGNGSDEILQALMMTFWSEGAKMMIPVPTFSMYGILGKLVGYELLEVSLDDNFDLCTDEMISLARREAVQLIFLASPNNPTGNCFSEERIVELIEQTDAVVVVDEAYAAFSNQDFLPKLEKYDNLVVLRTLSKIGLAGLRVGMMFAGRDLVYEVNKARLPYNLNSLSQKGAAFILTHDEELLAQIEKIKVGREWLLKKMNGIKGLHVYPSEANIILFRVPCSGDKLFRQLIEDDVLIRNLSRPGRLYNCLRVCVGTDDENSFFIDALERRLNG
ncbi:MAG: histidinol-phosphate transaminase [Deltaproteobacteria bacterium]